MLWFNSQPFSAQDLSGRLGLSALLQGGAVASVRGVLTKMNTHSCVFPGVSHPWSWYSKVRSKTQIIGVYLCMNVSSIMEHFIN